MNRTWDQVHDWIRLAAAFLGVDEWLVLGAVFVVAGLIGRSTARGLLHALTGSHLPMGSVAQQLLRLLNRPELWEISGGVTGGCSAAAM